LWKKITACPADTALEKITKKYFQGGRDIFFIKIVIQDNLAFYRVFLYNSEAMRNLSR